VLLKIKIKYFPSKFTKCRLREADKSAGSYDWKRDISIGLASEGKVRENPKKMWQTKISVSGGDCGGHDRDGHYHINP
jgi:hypothetical protein